MIDMGYDGDISELARHVQNQIRKGKGENYTGEVSKCVYYSSIT